MNHFKQYLDVNFSEWVIEEVREKWVQHYQKFFFGEIPPNFEEILLVSFTSFQQAINHRGAPQQQSVDQALSRIRDSVIQSMITNPFSSNSFAFSLFLVPSAYFQSYWDITFGQNRSFPNASKEHSFDALTKVLRDCRKPELKNVIERLSTFLSCATNSVNNSVAGYHIPLLDELSKFLIFVSDDLNDKNLAFASLKAFNIFLQNSNLISSSHNAVKQQNPRFCKVFEACLKFHVPTQFTLIYAPVFLSKLLENISNDNIFQSDQCSYELWMKPEVKNFVEINTFLLDQTYEIAIQQKLPPNLIQKLFHVSFFLRFSNHGNDLLMKICDFLSKNLTILPNMNNEILKMMHQASFFHQYDLIQTLQNFLSYPSTQEISIDFTESLQKSYSDACEETKKEIEMQQLVVNEWEKIETSLDDINKEFASGLIITRRAATGTNDLISLFNTEDLLQMKSNE